MSRTKNTKRNILWGFLSKIITVFMPFLTKTTIIYVMGVEYEGLSGVFTSILQVLSFAELGLGSALVYSMYSPIATGNVEKVRALLNLYKKCYRVIGLVVLVVGLCLVPFLNSVINRDLPAGINIYWLFSIYLLNNVLSYWIFAEKNSLLLACQRDDINSRVSLLVTGMLHITQIIVLVLLKNYYAYAIMIPVFTVLQNTLAAYYVKKFYPQFYCEGKVENNELSIIKKNVGGMVFQKIGNIVLSSADAIVISAFLGLRILGIYNGYHYIITALFGFCAVITRAITPSAGNSVVLMSKEKNYADFEKFNFLFQWIIIWWSACLLCLMQPFINIWLGENLILPSGMAIIFTIYFYIYKWMDMIHVYREASGIWWQGKWFPIIAAIINLGTNIIMVQIIGLAGVLISTIISLLLIHDTVGVYVLKKYFFQEAMNLKDYYTKQLLYLLCAIFVCAMTYLCTSIIAIDNKWLMLLLRAIICIIVPNCMLYFIMCRTLVFKNAKEFVKKKIFNRVGGAHND